jgi:hypothetical protein
MVQQLFIKYIKYNEDKESFTLESKLAIVVVFDMVMPSSTRMEILFSINLIIFHPSVWGLGVGWGVVGAPYHPSSHEVLLTKFEKEEGRRAPLPQNIRHQISLIKGLQRHIKICICSRNARANSM